jgi:hypothetical protein
MGGCLRHGVPRQALFQAGNRVSTVLHHGTRLVVERSVVDSYDDQLAIYIVGEEELPSSHGKYYCCQHSNPRNV